MDFADAYSSTDETLQFSPRYLQPANQSDQISNLQSQRRTRSLKKAGIHKKQAKVFDSTSTLIDNSKISQSLNSHNLKISLKGIYENDPVPLLQKIFKKNPISPNIPKRETLKHSSLSIQRSRRSKVDSIFQQNEADLIMDELKTIKNPEVWQQLVQNFKKKPSALMDLIPLQ